MKSKALKNRHSGILPISFTWIILLTLFLLPGCNLDDSKIDSDTSGNILASWGRKAAIDSSDNIYVTGTAYGDISDDSGTGESDIYLGIYDSSGSLTTLVQETGFDNDDFAMDIAVEPTSGNVYIAGYTDSELDASNDSGGSDIFIIKYNSAGTRQWLKQIGSGKDDFCWGIAIDSSENIFVTGSTYGVMPGAGVTNDVGIDLFLMKLDSSGNTDWVKQIEMEGSITEYTDSQSFGVSVAVDASDNVVMGGYTNDTLGSSKIGNTDVVLAKYDNSGNQSWFEQLGTTYSDYLQDVVVATSGNIYITGYTYGTIDASYDYSDYTENHDYSEMFLIKYNSSGTQQWVAQAGSSVNDFGYDAALDSSENVFMTGVTRGDVTGDNLGYTDFVVLKYDSSGNQQWVIQDGSTSFDTADGIVVDSSDDVFVTGRTYGTLNSVVNATSSFSAHLSKYEGADGSWDSTTMIGQD